MKRRAAIHWVGGTVLVCAMAPATRVWASDRIPFEPLRDGQRSKAQKAAQAAARSEKEWERARADLVGPLPGEPLKVDWEREMVLGIFLGMRPSSGYRVTIQEIRETKERLIVRYREHGPPPGAITLTVLTSPFQIVKLKRSVLPVEWKEVKEDG